MTTLRGPFAWPTDADLATRDTLWPLVLIVDDMPDARSACAAYLTFVGYRVATAADGYDAIDRAIALLPDVILMDLMLPELDGWQATERLKRDPRTRRIPIIAVSAHSLEGEARARARALGCEAFLAKPYLPEALALEIRLVLSARSRAVAGDRYPDID